MTDHLQTVANLPLPTQLSRVSVKSLFGLYDHAIDLRAQDRVTILHGPNGVGKTVLLRLIQAFFSGQYQLLIETNFSELIFVLSDGRSLQLHRVTSALEEVRRHLDIVDPSASDRSFRWSLDRGLMRKMALYIDGEVPYITRVAEDLWVDDRTGESYSITHLVQTFSDILPEKMKSSMTGDPPWLIDFRTSIKVHLVETQRLLLPDSSHSKHRFLPRSHARKAFASTVTTYSVDLRNRSAAALAAYAEHSQSLDRSFPQRMLGGPRTDDLNISDLKERMKRLEQRRVQLKQLGLIEDDTSYPFDIDTLDSATSTQKSVMTLYVEDTESKLDVLDTLQRKVDLLLGNINRKFQPNKQLRAERSIGLAVRDKRGLRIDLDSLSSGEQHELVLIYDLLFQVQPYSLVLVDEPELSLHVTWQKAFLKELFAIIEAVNFDVLIATHSPFIVGDRLDLMVPLGFDTTDDNGGSSDKKSRPREFADYDTRLQSQL